MGAFGPHCRLRGGIARPCSDGGLGVRKFKWFGSSNGILFDMEGGFLSMKLTERVAADLVAAMKERAELRLSVLRMLKAEF